MYYTGGYSYHTEKRVCLEMRHNPRRAGKKSVRISRSTNRQGEQENVEGEEEQEGREDERQEEREKAETEELEGLNTVKKGQSGPFKCEHCGKVFISEGSLVFALFQLISNNFIKCSHSYMIFPVCYDMSLSISLFFLC